ncbi:MAG: hypothetical protein NVS4B11_03640 [Ktedonobacteraceae bacterium]
MGGVHAIGGKCLRLSEVLETESAGWEHVQWEARKQNYVFELNSFGLTRSFYTIHMPGFTIAFRLLALAGVIFGRAAMLKVCQKQ